MIASRRALLLGLAGLAGACARPRGAARALGFGGGIVGGHHARGHRLRDAPEPPRPQGGERIRVAIVGAGMAGLSAAWALARAGLDDFVVLELEDAPGGTSRSGEGPVTPYPWAAHYVPVPDPANTPLVALLEEIGAVSGRDGRGRPVYGEDVLCRDPSERVYFRGEWYEGLYPRAAATPRDVEQLVAFEREMARLSAWRDGRGRRAFDIPRARSSDAAEMRGLDGLSMAAYLDAWGWDSPRLRWLVEYACRDDFGATLAQTSAWAGVHYFAARLDEGGQGAPFLTWPEGNGRLVRHLAGVCGDRLRTGTLVRAVEPEKDGVRVLYEDAAGAARGLVARDVILAVPRFLVPRLLAGTPAVPGLLYGSWMVANVTLRDRPRGRGFPLAWDNVLYDSPSLGYVVATHQSGRDHGPTVLTYYLPLLDDDPARGRARLLATPWEDWARAVLADLAPSHPGIDALVERLDVYLWGHAMVRPAPGLLWSDALRAAAVPRGRVRFAHTDLSAMALCEEAQAHGLAAAAHVLAEAGVRRPAWLA